MKLINNEMYMQDINRVIDIPFDWNKIKNTCIMISGASGMIGSCIVDILMHKNINYELNCSIVAIGRDIEKAKKRFCDYWESDYFTFIQADINDNLDIEIERIDYIIHAASNTHPVAYASDPIGTINTNIIGTNNLLKLAVKYNTKRTVFLSSVEIYGENRGDVEKFDEPYCGHIDCNTLRAGYPESKRVGEALCQAYISKNNLDVVIPRLSRVYGPNMLMDDTKAVSQFIRKGVQKEDIILKSEGTQFYSYSYVFDVVAGILWCLFKGKNGQAYNICSDNSDITLRDLAEYISVYSETRVRFEVPDIKESKGYSTATVAILENNKLKQLGWKSNYDIKTGIARTIKILKDISE